MWSFGTGLVFFPPGRVWSAGPGRARPGEQLLPRGGRPGTTTAGRGEVVAGARRDTGRMSGEGIKASLERTFWGRVLPYVTTV